MALANIVLGDGLSPTPVNRTFEVFTPQVGNSPAILLQKAGGVTKSNERMTLLTRRSANAAYRLQLAIALPRTTNVATGEVQTGHIDISIVLPDGFTLANRNDVAAYLKNLAASAVVQDSIKNITSFA